MTSSHRTVGGRILAIVTGVALLIPLIAVPAVSAAPPSRAAAAHVLERGSVTPRAAAIRARGVERPASSHRTLTPSGYGDRFDGGAGLRLASRNGGVRIAAPAPVSVSAFPGIGRIPDGLDVEPPDPWVAVSSSHVVQATNAMVRIFDRKGTPLVSAPTWALFALDPSERDADPRILWDAAHARWVGVLMSFQEDFSLNYLNVAVSETSDPTGAWDIYSYEYTDAAGDPTLPDYPGIASSTDKIVLTANEFTTDGLGNLGGFVGASLLVVRWSDILAGLTPFPTTWTLADPGMFTIRPAQVLSSSADVHLVGSDTSAGDILYAKLVGTAPSVAWQDLTTAAVVDPLCATQAPRQPGSPATIVDAVDERLTDAIWRSGRLAFVSTCLATFDQGATVDDYVRVTILSTATATPTKVIDDLLGAGAGSDSYMGGIGFSGDGTLFVSYTESSTGQFASTRAAAYYAGLWSPSILVNPGVATYEGTRWGDYVGVATDPAGSAAVWQANEVPDADGEWQTQVSRLVFDLVPPTVGAPSQSLIAGSTLGSYAIPVKVGWTGTDSGSGIASSSLFVDQFNTGLFPAGTTLGLATTRTHWWRPNTSIDDVSYQYGVITRDGYGNDSGVAPVLGSRLSPIVYQQTSASYSSGWATSSSSQFSGGSTRASSTAGKYASFTTSARSLGFLTYRSSTRGRVKVYIDGVYKTTLTLTSSTVKARYLAYAVTFPTTGTHTIKLVVSSGRVDVDAFVVLR